MLPLRHIKLQVANVLPVLFVAALICIIWSIHMSLHLVPLLQVGVAADELDAFNFSRGRTEFCISQLMTILLLLSYFRAVITNPGSVPEKTEWLLPHDGPEHTHSDILHSPQTNEVKATGERRWCKWCGKYKPDRCHHCRVCRTCVLKMDHHCPWIMNCVGFRNHKYFFLLVFYVAINCNYIVCTMYSSVRQSVVEETPAANRFLLVLAMVLSSVMAIIMNMFLSFHSYLMVSALTTIEFCEKTVSGNKKRTAYDHGLYENFCAVLGPHPLLWLLPLSPPEGDGVTYSTVKLPADVVYHRRDPEWTA
eukprot:gnl/TRDRNA2_/TRDRNA2_183180_c0_seq1.p1 gnl/TRDRNA2_/TRDRNA2_183180_c0~~gnl/TRDRNA2_/TRDRNA2_183180_c0_seq1.p1  ORF type:complete len:307 (-),score=32.43 gnl/TRDRNA2_/TRDRNA2_183180_c0_seq1:118-1038(-)